MTAIDIFPSVPLKEVFINAQTLQIMAVTGNGIWWCQKCLAIWPDSHLTFSQGDKSGLICPMEECNE